jgi:hypothetical protein
MAQGFEDSPSDAPVPGDSAAKISGQRARQGQNIKGMVLVLVIGTLLVAGAFAIMLSLQAEPSSVVNESRVEAATSAPVQQPLPANPETAGSPNQAPN